MLIRAYETIDDIETIQKDTLLNVNWLWEKRNFKGGKGDIMIPNAHINEGTADNYFSI
jgi:hypothetical protein